MAPRPPPKLAVTLPSPHHSTLQWHPAMAPRPLPQSWPSPSPTIAHYNAPYDGTQQWHHGHSPEVGRHLPPPTIAHYNGTTSTPPKLAVTLPNDSTLQWHRTMAPSNGTTSTPPKLVVTFPLQPWHTTMAPCNGTTSTPPLQWHPGATSSLPKWFVALPPIGSKNPYSYRYLGNYVPDYQYSCYKSLCVKFSVQIGTQCAKIVDYIQSNPQDQPQNAVAYSGKRLQKALLQYSKNTASISQQYAPNCTCKCKIRVNTVLLY